ncbi:L-threonylcarbamoyladenylate synthase [Macrococcoides caseolyticum]|uniref:L-threonylcarbamoyladenylate synthase n=1 Tax=Macrococcoides caseolyticum TaxID=69966 RepID=UPI001F326703|nr:L-threonylcarbamoyladenylate synthase [Macrococcus caseolyticus]MCE4957584.1 threonylcarbamoyl-AMP synthase [Macrococcus caseolyticus]
MKTIKWDVRNFVDDLSTYPQVDEIVNGFKEDEIIAIPTETVYGLAANALSNRAVDKIFMAKGRPQDNPLIVHIYDIAQIDAFAHIPNKETQLLMTHFWPGPISFILPLREHVLASSVTAGLQSVAVRMPSDPIARQLLKLSQLPLAAPSANTSGKPSPTTAEHVLNDLNGKIYGVVQGNQVDVGIESTVVDCTTYPFMIARPGAITAEDLEAVVSGCITKADYHLEQPIAPGMKYRHYAPDSPMILTHDLSQLKLKEDEALIAPKSELAPFINYTTYALSETFEDISGAMHNLYSALRAMDEDSGISKIYIADYSHIKSSEALMNRINKATSGK